MSVAVGSEGRVFSVEPEPKNFAHLTENLVNNAMGNVTPLNMAVDCVTGSCLLSRSESNPGCHSLIASAVTDLKDKVTVSTVTLDQLWAKFIDRKNVDVLKLDIEGNEGRALLGAAEMLRHTKYVWLEFWPYGLELAGTDPFEMLNRLVSIGFSFVLFDLVTGFATKADVVEIVNYCRLLETRFVEHQSGVQPLVYLLCVRCGFGG